MERESGDNLVVAGLRGAGRGRSKDLEIMCER